MKKGDILWPLGLAAFLSILIIPSARGVFLGATASHPYLVGFAKFFILATMGELLALRIVSGAWKRPTGLFYRAVVWGILGMAIVLVFEVFSSGVASAQAKGLLPFGASRLGFAFLTSAIMNLAFAPAMMLAHRLSDTFIDLKYEAKNARIGIGAIVERIDWKGFVSFVLFKTIPLFWIPAHTVTFLLPPSYRVLAAAFLSVALGSILAFAKRRPRMSGSGVPDSTP